MWKEYWYKKKPTVLCIKQHRIVWERCQFTHYSYCQNIWNIRNFTLYSPCILTSIFNSFNQLMHLFYFIFSFLFLFWFKKLKDYEMSCTSGIRGRRNRRQLRSWVVCVCVCDVPRCSAGSLPGLFWRFGHVSVWYTCSRVLGTQLIHCLIWGVYNSGRNWYIALSGGADNSGRNWYAFLTSGRNSYVPSVTVLTLSRSHKLLSREYTWCFAVKVGKADHVCGCIRIISNTSSRNICSLMYKSPFYIYRHFTQ